MDETNTPEPLSSEELLAFAGLARLLIAADGRFSDAEAAALEDAAADLCGTPALGGGPYREQAVREETTYDPRQVWEALDHAAAALPDEASVKQAAQAVTRQQAREAIFGALYVIAASDVIAKSEWPLLEWLTAEWGVAIRP